MTTIATHGFLSDEAENSVKAFEAKYSEICSLYRRLGEFAHLAKYEFKGGGRNARQILVALLFGRTLTAYEGTYLLAARGMEHDYQALLRTLLDTMFHAVAADKNHENVRAIIWASEHQKVKVLQAVLAEDNKAQPKGDHSELEKQIEKLRKDVQASGTKPMNMREVMSMAELPSWMYQLAYRSLCLSAHPDANRLQKALKTASDGSVREISWGPQYGGVELELTFAMDCLIFVMQCKSLGMPKSMLLQLQQFSPALERIHERLAREGDASDTKPT